ncbi:hypothetical protein JANAI62_13480 [Jannaschia pagri]|uniref:Lipoprotein n=2 Tax=Jannaschia TaxID=188905 RepID=A0ABQ4NKG3_9RHOB|nr:hypothetical protein JANAI61_13520 [Jannaschia sp. AI_61]GIT94725.1 hypothetical protein JANAI62_13480 [Jannaschia sp. AI_62]
MVPANKILTVAYGTFSCTLEGFDDPFSTMTDIAEYFRDLAAQDRYFGAEPPTPDMAMLRQIAEAKTQSAVEAEGDDSGVRLRPAAATPAAPDVIAQPIESDAEPVADPVVDAAVAVTDEDVPAEVATQVDEADLPVGEAASDELPAVPDVGVAEVSPEIEAAAEGDAPAEDTALDQSAAAKLARIRNAVAEEEAFSSPYSEDQHAEDEGLIERLQDTLEASFETAEETIATVNLTDASDDIEGDAELQADGSADEDADELLRVGDAVADSGAAEVSMDAAVAAVAAEPTPKNTVETLAQAVAHTARRRSDQDEASIPAESAKIEEQSNDGSEDVTVGSDDVPAKDASSERPRRRIRVRKVRRAAAAAEAAAEAAASLAADRPAPTAPSAPDGAMSADQPPQNVPSQDTAEAAAVDASAPAASDGPTASDLNLGDDEEADLMAELAAIEAELGRDATGANVEDDIDEVLAPAAASASMGDDDLMAELAAIRAVEELDDTPAEAPAPAPSFDAPDDDETAHVDEKDAVTEPATDAEAEPTDAAFEEVQTAVEDAGEETPAAATDADPEDLERLFAATDSRLSGEDTSRRHANISHLKAAVAARRADDTMETVKVDDSGAYRADLASTVRPRRATKSEEPVKTARPERNAPLVLVSEQRIAEAAQAPQEAPAPVAPRRAPRVADMDREIEAKAPPRRQTPDMGDDFEQFAQDVGATDLADVLEAAAVYSATVMGEDKFSRPRLLHLAAEAVDDLSREDGLRGFGQLLREGTLRKVSRGTFTLGTDSRFRRQAERRVG